MHRTPTELVVVSGPHIIAIDYGCDDRTTIIVARVQKRCIIIDNIRFIKNPHVSLLKALPCEQQKLKPKELPYWRRFERKGPAR